MSMKKLHTNWQQFKNNQICLLSFKILKLLINFIIFQTRSVGLELICLSIGEALFLQIVLTEVITYLADKVIFLSLIEKTKTSKSRADFLVVSFLLWERG